MHVDDLVAADRTGGAGTSGPLGATELGLTPTQGAEANGDDDAAGGRRSGQPAPSCSLLCSRIRDEMFGGLVVHDSSQVNSLPVAESHGRLRWPACRFEARRTGDGEASRHASIP